MFRVPLKRASSCLSLSFTASMFYWCARLCSCWLNPLVFLFCHYNMCVPWRWWQTLTRLFLSWEYRFDLGTGLIVFLFCCFNVVGFFLMGADTASHLLRLSSASCSWIDYVFLFLQYGFIWSVPKIAKWILQPLAAAHQCRGSLARWICCFVGCDMKGKGCLCVKCNKELNCTWEMLSGVFAF